MKRFFLFVVFIFALGFDAPLHAEEAGNESLEWLVTSRPAIAVEVVSQVLQMNGAAGVNNSVLEIQTHLTETLKGQPQQQASFSRHWKAVGTPGESDGVAPEKGTEFLLFFDDKGQVTNAFNLKFPSRKRGIGADARDVAVAADYTVFKSGEVIRDAVHRRLVQLSKNASAANSKQVSIPLESAAWSVLCDSGACIIVVPDDAQSKNTPPAEVPLMRVAEYSGPALVDECGNLPKTAFQIKSTIPGRPHTMSIGCSPYPNATVDPKKMTITFRVQDIEREQDYDFQWDINPDTSPPDQKGFFTDDKRGCDDMARVLQFRVQGQVPFVAPAGTSDTSQPMVATWKAECLPNDRWGYVLVFELNVRYASNAPASSSPVAPVATAPIVPSTPAAPATATAPVPTSAILAPAK